jgi:hypothetical protein
LSFFYPVLYDITHVFIFFMVWTYQRTLKDRSKYIVCVVVADRNICV